MNAFTERHRLYRVPLQVAFVNRYYGKANKVL
jgi:hypothetical protein